MCLFNNKWLYVIRATVRSWYSQVLLGILCIGCLFLPARHIFAPPVYADAIPWPNWSFETYPGGGLTDWTMPSNGWTWESGIARSGSHSARAQAYGSQTSSLMSALVLVQPSTVYTLKFWLRTSGATWYPRVLVYQRNAQDVIQEDYLLAYTNIGSGTNDWTLATYRFQTKPDTAKIRLNIYIGGDTSGTFWFDDFELDEEGAAPFPYQPGFPVQASDWSNFSSPTVADIDADGDNELLVGVGNRVDGWDHLGNSLPGYPLVTDDQFIIGQLALADLDGDNDLEIVVGTQARSYYTQGRVFVYHHNGAVASGWPKSVEWNTQYAANKSWISSVVLADIAGDRSLEILAATTNNSTLYSGSSRPSLADVYAWQRNGQLVSGWPARVVYAGSYGAMAAGDVDGDGKAEVVVGRDGRHLSVHDGNASLVSGWPIETYIDINNGDYYHTKQRIVHTFSAPSLADLDGDGFLECITSGHTMGPGNDVTVLNSGTLVLEPDGTRRPGWQIAALGDGILGTDTMPRQGTAVADLDRDGRLEFVVPTSDGKIRAYRHDGTVLWTVDYGNQNPFLFASEPVIGDIDQDGELEIVFGTYVPMLFDGNVGIWGLEADGTLMTGFPLPVATPGVRAAPTLADLDQDGDLEILVVTKVGQIFVWDTPASDVPGLLPWPMGRQDLHRSATLDRSELEPSLEASSKFAEPIVADQGERSTFTIRVVSTGPVEDTISVTDVIPAGLQYVSGSVLATSGTAWESGSTIYWSGQLVTSSSVDITYQVEVITSQMRKIDNTVSIELDGDIVTKTGYIFANGESRFLPFVTRYY